MAITPRPHQLAALKAIKKGFTKHKRGQGILACGTGKSLLAAWAVKASKARTVLVLVPSLALVRQVRESFLQVFPRLASVAVCSDKTVAGRDSVSIDPSEVGCLVTTDGSLVRAHLKQKGQRVVFCTYQSASLLAGFKFDFAIFDEAHKTAGRIDKAFGFALDDKNIAIKKRLFLTATPRVVRLPVDTEETEDVASMDDPQVYGSRFYSLPFREAVEEKIICGYRLIISEINEDVDTEHHAALQVAIQKSMDDRGIKKVFAFFRTVEQAQTFANDTAGFDPSVTVLHVNGSMSTGERKLVIAQFEKAERAVLTNARCLTEGVDVPAVDMVVFAQAKRSTIDIVQAAGRAMRNSPGKNLGFIFLPVWRNAAAEETFEAAASREGFKPVLDVLRALSDQDALLEAVLEDLRKKGGGGGGGEKVIVYEGPDLEALRRAVTHAIVEQPRSAGYWNLQTILSAAATCSSLTEFTARYSGAYDAAARKGWLALLPFSKGWPIWDPASCEEEARKHAGRSAFHDHAQSAYIYARDSGLLDVFFPEKKTSRKWRLDNLKLEAAKYSSRGFFAEGNAAAYQAALKLGLIDTFFPEKRVPPKWTYETTKKAAAEHPTRGSLLKNNHFAYQAAQRNGWLAEFYPEKGNPRKWTYEVTKKAAAEHPDRGSLLKHSSVAYHAAQRNGWLDEFYPKKKVT